MSGALGRQVGTSALWQAANAGILRVASFFVALVVAHLVAPYFFGVFTVAITVYNVVSSIATLGVPSAIVREPERTAEIAPTIQTLSVVMNLALTVLMFVTAPFLARELGASSAVGAVRVLSVVIVLGGFSAVPASLMSRDFMQRQRFATDAAFLVSSTAVMLVLVGLGHPVMGLALSRVAGQLVSVILMNVLAPEHYGFGFCASEARALLSFGLPLAGANLVTLAIANVDFIVIGHLLGATQLGFYNLAFNISGWPVSIFSAVLVSVTLPTLSRVRNDPVELARHLEAGLSAVVAASFPVSALLSALAVPLIDIVYGSRWQHASTALIILTVFGAAQTVLTLFSDLLIALGLTRRLLVIQLVWLLFLAPAMILGVHGLKIAGAGVAHASVVVLAVMPLYLMTVARRTDVSLDWIRRSVAVPLFAALVSGGLAYGSTHLVSGHLLQLFIGIVVGVAAYCLCSGRWLLRVIRTLRQMYWLPTPDPDSLTEAATA